jgi:uncharacterized membrane protein
VKCVFSWDLSRVILKIRCSQDRLEEVAEKMHLKLKNREGAIRRFKVSNGAMLVLCDTLCYLGVVLCCVVLCCVVLCCVVLCCVVLCCFMLSSVILCCATSFSVVFCV